MDFAWPAETQELHERARAFAADALGIGGGFSRERWRRLGEFGLLGLSVPEAAGGLGLGALATARTLEGVGLGAKDAGLAFSAAAHLFACVMPIAEHGSPDTRAALLRPLARGELIGANAITEAEAGSDVFALKTRAERDGDDYVLTGTKSYVTNGPVADVLVVYATSNPKHGYLGVSAFAVDRATPGLEVGEPFPKLGLGSSPIGAVYLDGCRVPAHRRLGAEGQGALVFKSSMGWERACLFAIYLGIMERQLSEVVRFAAERRQFGAAIARNQAVSHRIADMKVRLESARLLLYRACWLRDQGRDASVEISIAKLAVSEAAVQSGLDAIHIHGGLGVMSETGIDAALRDALPATIFSGTSDIQRDLIARGLGL